MNHSPWLEHAEALLEERDLEPALACFNIAERRGADPDRCSAGRWLAWMLLGNFDRAWQESDAIRRRGAHDPHRFWNGNSIRCKRLIVRCLHGFGDSVQFLRYLPALRRLAAHVILEVAPRFVDIAHCIDGVDQVITWGEHAPAVAPPWDVQIEIIELPYFFRTRQRDLPVATDYIPIPQDLQLSAARAFPPDSRPRAGIVWSSGEWDLSRSLPIEQVKHILSEPGFIFWNLQGGEVRNQWSQLGAAPTLFDAPAFCADRGLLPLAAFIAQLDLVITVDTLAAHLAGALGRPVWLMLQHAADWRWMTARDDSPWYPSMRIFRQQRQGDWAGVARQVRHALAEIRTSARKVA
ncbi:MAG TPA: hypothetical protein VGL22_02250 [Terracidiphilus sp.]